MEGSTVNVHGCHVIRERDHGWLLCREFWFRVLPSSEGSFSTLGSPAVVWEGGREGGREGGEGGRERREGGREGGREERGGRGREGRGGREGREVNG